MNKGSTEILTEEPSEPPEIQEGSIISAHVEEEEDSGQPGRKSRFSKIVNLLTLILIFIVLLLITPLVQKQQDIRKQAVPVATTYPMSTSILSLKYFPVTPCYSPAQKIDLTAAIASSNASPVYPSTQPQYAIDGLTETKWMPKPPYKGTYFLVDLGSNKALRVISLRFWYIDRPQEYHLDVSSTGSFSGEQIRVVTETDGLTGYYQDAVAPLERKDYIFDPIQARFIKLTIDAYRTGTTDESGQINLYEFEVYSGLEEKSCLDTSVTGDVGVKSNPTMADPLSEIRERVQSHNQNIIQTIQEGSKFHGYKDPSAVSSLQHSLYEDREFLEPIPISSTYLKRPDYMKILNDLNICHYVDNLGVKEVWIWSYHTDKVIPEESNMAMGHVSKDFWNETNKFDVKPQAEYGDISNSSQLPDLPVCNKTYVLFNFTYIPSYANAVHSYLHQIENELAYADREMFWDMFVGKQYQFSGPRRCGHSHTPPNSNSDYSYADQNYESSDCEDWLPVNCIDLDKNASCGGVRQTFNCTRWNCEELKYYLWWMQNLPGKDNNLMFGSERLRNWWDFLGDFDEAIGDGKSLTFPEPTPTPTPIPTVVLTPTPTPSPTNTITVSNISMTYTQKGQNINISVQVTVVDEVDNRPVPFATVELMMTTPSGEDSQLSSLTKKKGIAGFAFKAKGVGVYTATVTNVTKEGYSYNPTNTTQTLTVP